MNTVINDTRFIGLQIEGFKKIKVANFDFDGKKLVPIYGKNGAGKSSVIEAIEVLFKGKTAVKDDIVNNKSEKAVIIAKIDGYVIRRSINKSGDIQTTVKRSDGKEVAKPQNFLDALAGYFLDPQEFSNLPGEEKKKHLMNYAGISFTEIDSQIKDLENERLIVGREIKKIGEVIPVEKVEPVVLTDLLQKRTELEKWNKEQRDQKEKITAADTFIKDLKSEIELKKAELEKLENKLVESEKRKEALVPAEEEKPLTEIDKSIKNAEKTNIDAAKYEDYLKKDKDKKDKDTEYKKQTDDIEDLRQFKQDVLKGANLPLNGDLVITDTGLSYKGIPDQNWSDAESIKISAHIAAHFSKDLKAMYIKRGESLDSTSLAELKAFAEENNYQIFCHIVSDEKGDFDGFYLCDGEIVID